MCKREKRKRKELFPFSFSGVWMNIRNGKRHFLLPHFHPKSTRIPNNWFENRGWEFKNYSFHSTQKHAHAYSFIWNIDAYTCILSLNVIFFWISLWHFKLINWHFINSGCTDRVGLRKFNALSKILNCAPKYTNHSHAKENPFSLSKKFSFLNRSLNWQSILDNQV